jgi:hypothetical protein
LNPFKVNFRLVWLAFGLISIASNACAQFVPMEGHATLDVLLVHGQTILCSKKVSGSEDELFALNSNTRTVQWRQEVKASGFTAVAETNGAFYMFARDFLQKRDLQTGKLLWETRLDSIPQQKPALKPSLSTRVGPFGRTPNRYAYKPVLSGSSLVVFREATRSSGCVIEGCFNDWLVFNRNTGKQASGGSGERLGEAGSSLLVDDVAGFGLIRNGQIQDLDIEELNSSRFHNWFNYPARRSTQYSWNCRCVFKNWVTKMEEIFIYDEGKSETDAFKLPVVPDFQVNWVLLDSRVLRYAECPAYSPRTDSGSAEEKRNGRAPWFELYDLKGKLIAKSEAGALTNEHWFYSFLGTSPKGKVLFHDGKGCIVVETPSLRVTTSSASNRTKGSESETSYTSWHMDRGSPHLYEVRGNTTIHKMTNSQMNHAFQIDAIEADTGQRIWEYIEPTTIKKL